MNKFKKHSICKNTVKGNYGKNKMYNYNKIMYINNHTHIYTKNDYLDIIEIVGFSCLFCIVGVVFQKYFNTTRIN